MSQFVTFVRFDLTALLLFKIPAGNVGNGMSMVGNVFTSSANRNELAALIILLCLEI